MSRLESVVGALASTLAVRDIPATPEAFAAFLDGAGLDPADRRAIEALGPKRFFLYRTLVRGNFRAAIRNELEDTARLLGPKMDEDIARFLDEGMPRSHYMLDAAFEFVAWARDRWPSDSTIPPWTLDLARHELLAYEVSAARDPEPPLRFEPSLAIDRPLVFDTAARLDTYAYPVHLLADDAAAHLEPKRTWLLVYRDPTFDIRHLDLTELAAAAMQAWLDGATLAEGLSRASAATGVPMPLEDAAKFLADLAERGVLLGARPKD